MSEDVYSVSLFKKLRSEAILPTRGSDGSGGYDLYTPQDFVLRPLNYYSDPTSAQPLLIRTGISIILPQGHCGMYWCRSSLGKVGMVIHGGFIDSDYRGELCICMSSLYKTLEFKAGDRICQMAITPCFMPGIVDYDRQGGFGSTGK